MARPESKSPNIAFDSDSESDSSDDETSQVGTNLLTPTPTIAERLKKANEDLLTHPSPPNSRASRIGFRDENEVLEFTEDSERDSKPTHPISPLVTNALIKNEPMITDSAAESSRGPHDSDKPEEEYADDFEEADGKSSTEPDSTNEQTAEISPKKEEPPKPVEPVKPEPEMVESSPKSPMPKTPEPVVDNSPQKLSESSMSLVEENGQFSMVDTNDNATIDDNTGSIGGSGHSISSSQQRRNDINPDYKSPYALTEAQKKMGRQRQQAKLRRLKAEEELKRTETQEQVEENESSFQAWIDRKKESQKEEKEETKKEKMNSSNMMNEQLSQEERDEIWQEWLKVKAKQNRKERIVEHQREIEKMEGLYVRSRQENDKAFRKWKKKKAKEAEKEEEERWYQVQMSKAELRQIRENQKRKHLLNAAKVASALDFL